ncbi:MAG: oxygenase MpaB family protein [Erythrobacter sp.]|jgi:uncharacterized protein (DUF2236 family)
MPPPSPTDYLRNRLVSKVRGVFNDIDGGEQPVPLSDMALFERDSPIRRVHADIVAMMVGGIRGLLLQMLHPHALQGVLDHSSFREDMHGRLRRTARFIAVTSFGHRDDAMAAIARVNRIHAAVGGRLPDGTPYAASDPKTLAWVHVAEATSFLAAYLRHVRPDMPVSEQDEYFRQFAVIARELGADPVPLDRREAGALFRKFTPELHSSAAAREVARLVLAQRHQDTPPAVQALIGTDAVALLPPFARSMLALERPGLRALPMRAATWGMGKALRWAFRQD